MQPIQLSTYEKVYYLPQEIKIAEILKQINIGGLKIHSKDIPNIKIKNYANTKPIEQGVSLRDVIKEQREPFVKL